MAAQTPLILDDGMQVARLGRIVVTFEALHLVVGHVLLVQKLGLLETLDVTDLAVTGMTTFTPHLSVALDDRIMTLAAVNAANQVLRVVERTAGDEDRGLGRAMTHQAIARPFQRDGVTARLEVTGKADGAGDVEMVALDDL